MPKNTYKTKKTTTKTKTKNATNFDLPTDFFIAKY